MSVLGTLALVLAYGPALGSTGQDDLQWLEAPHDAKALAWARQATAQTREKIAASASGAAITAELKTALAEGTTAPSQVLQGDHALRFLRDAAHPYGLVQLAPRDRNGLATNGWTTVLDMAQLRKQEGVPFELQPGSLGSCLAPEYNRCLLSLSPGGGDEVEIREFDLKAAAFVADGFRVPKSRAFANWLGPDKLVVGTTSGGEPKTAAGFPAALRIWTRGQPLTDAKLVYQAKPTDTLMLTSTIGEGKARQIVVTRWIDFSHFEISLIDAAGQVRPTGLPLNTKRGPLASTDHHMVLQLAEATTLDGVAYPAETLIGYDVDPKVPEGKRISRIYTPAQGEFVGAANGIGGGLSQVAFVVSKDLLQRVVGADLARTGGWRLRDVLQADAGQVVNVRADDGLTNELVAAITGYTTPRSQYLLRPGQPRRLMAQDPALIDAGRYTTEVGHAISKDGTSIDYYLLRPRASKWQDGQPVLMTGYGAFGQSVMPGYFTAGVGGPAFKLWLERDGSLVVPVIRGGGERGAAWHAAAMREKRQNSYDDFIAVTEHLIATGYTKPSRIGVFGSSNGGLLAAVMGLQRPDLFGAIVSDVPLTDLFRMKYMGMGAAWLNEYGDPEKDPAMAEVLARYSPLQNVREGVRYPPFLVTISTEDNRVGPGHARKLAYRLQEAGAEVMFYEDEEGGHGVSDPLRNPELMGVRLGFFIDHLMSVR